MENCDFKNYIDNADFGSTGFYYTLSLISGKHGFNPEGGTKNYAFSTKDTHSELCDAIRLSKGYRKEKWVYFLRAESFYNVATTEEEYAGPC